MASLRTPETNNDNNTLPFPTTGIGTNIYRPQVIYHQTNRIMLPPRFSAAAVVLLLLVTSSVVFVLAQPRPQLAPLSPIAPIARAEAAPVAPVIDPRLDEVAAMMPDETVEALPTTAKPVVVPAKPHPVSLTVTSRPAPAPTSQPTQIEILTAQGITSGKQGDYDAAEQYLRNALALDRGNPTILYNLAVVAERRGDNDSARTLYEATLRQAAERPDTPLKPERVTARLEALDESE